MRAHCRGAVHEVFDRGNLDDRFRVHSRSDPNPTVRSPPPLRWYWTVRHPSCTPIPSHVPFFAGFQTSIRASMPSLSSGWLHAGQWKPRRSSLPAACRHPLCRTAMSAWRATRLSAPRPSYREDGEAKEGEHLDDRINPIARVVRQRAKSRQVEPQPVVVHPISPSRQRFPEAAPPGSPHACGPSTAGDEAT